LEVLQTTRVLPDFAEPVRLRRRSTTLSRRGAIFSTTSGKQGGKAMPSTRSISANRIDIFLREQAS